MPWNDASEIVVANGGQVSVAPVGTTLPTHPTNALAAAFVGLGYISEDGATLQVSPEINEVNAWQSRQAVRRDLQAQEVQAQFELLQWNEETVPFAFGGGEVTSVSGGYRYDLPEEGDALDERSLVIDANDGSRHLRIVLVRGNVTDDVESKFTRDDPAILPITFKALEPTTGGAAAYILTDDSSAFTAGS